MKIFLVSSPILYMLKFIVVGTLNNHNLMLTNAFVSFKNDGCNPLFSSFGGKRQICNLMMTSEDNDENKSDMKNRIYRLDFHGVSVSSKGFVSLLSLPLSTNNIDPTRQITILPIEISSNKEDEFSASSLEALTFVQLLSGIDVASEGSLSVQTLQRIAAFYASSPSLEEDQFYNHNKDAVTIMREVFKDEDYWNATTWSKSRVNYPKVGLDELQISSIPSSPESHNLQFELKCRVKDKPLTIVLTNNIVRQYGKFFSLPSLPTQTSSEKNVQNKEFDSLNAFLSLSLALRYKSPVTLSSIDSLLDTFVYQIKEKNKANPMPKTDEEEEQLKLTLLERRYPKWKSVTSLSLQSSMTQKTVEKGFEVHRLEGALKIALERNDLKAAEKIKQKMKEYDTFHEEDENFITKPDESILFNVDDEEGGEEVWG